MSDSDEWSAEATITRGEDEDVELAALMTSALDDFDRQKAVKKTAAKVPTSTPAASQGQEASNGSDESGLPPFDASMMNEVDDIFKNMMSQDPQLREHWQRLAESCTQAAETGADEDFEKSLQDTIKKMSENVQSLPKNSDIPDEEMAKIWSNLGMASDNAAAANGVLPDIMPLVTTMMQNLLSKDILYPALKDLTDKYPVWLDQNGSSLSDDDRKRYEKQLQLMCQVVDHFEQESPSDSDDKKGKRFQQILTTMQRMQECGSPPKDLVGDVPDIGSPAFDMSKFPGLNPSGSQCSIQ